MTWLSRLSYCIAFQIRKKRKNKRTYRLEVNVVFHLVIFLLNQSKNNTFLEPRTGHFQGFVGFETKAKDLSFEAEAKHFQTYPRGHPQDQGRPRGLHL